MVEEYQRRLVVLLFLAVNIESTSVTKPSSLRLDNLPMPSIMGSSPPITSKERRLLDTSRCSLQDCSTDNADCSTCVFPPDCIYGTSTFANCTTNAICHKRTTSRLEAKCRFCYQVEKPDVICEPVRNCSSSSVNLYRTQCRVADHVICIGRRNFMKNIKCHWTSGYSWIRALFLSVTLGGFGVDRFYLGWWKSGIGKLFSFGGLGLWTLVDIFLIAIGYIQPADGSNYI